MIGISLIPALYNIIFLSSMWEPYGQLSDLPVAVVNNDKEASYNGNTMAIGKDMVSNLKENKTLDFHFVDEEEGKKGLEDGDYYMVVTLPSDLSEKTTTLSNIQSTAAYQSLTSDSVSQNSTDSIQSAQSIVALVQDLQGSLENLQNQSSNLSTLKNQSNQVSPITSTSLIGLSSGLTEIQGDVTSKLVPASQSIASGVNAYTTGVDKVSQGASQLSEKNATLTGSLDKLVSGSNTLTQKSSRLTAGVG